MSSDLSESMVLSKPRSVSLLKLYRLQSNNIYPLTVFADFPKVFKKSPLEEEIMELALRLKDCAEFYGSLVNPEKIHETSWDVQYEGQIEKQTQRLEELLNKHNNNAKRHRCIFFECRGGQNLIKCIKSLGTFVMRKDVTTVPKQVTLKRLKGLLTLFDTLYLGEMKMPAEVSYDEELVQVLFPLFEFKEIFEHVLHALEDLLIGRDSVFPLYKLKDYYRLVDKLDQRQLGQFANIIALLIFEHNKEDFTDIFVKKEQLRLFPTFKQITLNQAIVANTPGIITRFTSLIDATIKELKQNDLLLALFERQDGSEPGINSPLISAINDEYPRQREDSTVLQHAKKLATHLNNTKMLDKIFNSYIYNTSEPLGFNKSPVTGKETVKEALEKKHSEESKHTEERKEIRPAQPEPTTESTYAQYMYLIKINKNQIVEILFVLSTLLSGKRKAEFQRKLLNFDFVNRITTLHKQIRWQPFNFPTDVALKIQFLRLAHNLTSRDEWDVLGKMLLLSREEVNTLLFDEIKVFMMYYYVELGVNSDSDLKEFFSLISNPPHAIKSAYSELYTTGQPIYQGGYIFPKKYDKITDTGLLMQVLKNYQEITDLTSNIRFWMSSFVESFLRGTYNVLQLFVARSGVFRTIAKDIITIEEKDNMNLQTSFDLLGEVLKFNKRTMLLFESFISSEEFLLICGKITSHIIDSNVLIRSLVISLNKFDSCDRKYCQSQGIPFIPFTSKCKLLGFIEENKYQLLKSLVLSVRPTTISQTNISCINTVIIILIFERFRGNLHKILEQLYADELSTQEPYISNIKELLVLWQDYYDYRPRDSLSLEFTTKIKFRLWINTVKEILEHSHNLLVTMKD